MSEASIFTKPLFGKPPTVALDIGRDTLKIAAVESGGRIRSLWQGEFLPERQYQEQKLEGLALRHQMVDLIERCRKECPQLKRSVVCGLNGEGTVSRYIELPVLTPKELEFAVPSKAREFLPYPVEDVMLSYIAVPQLSKGEKKTAIFFVGAPREFVEETRTLLKHCNLEMTRLEVPEIAMVREYSRNHMATRDGFVALIQVGYRLTHVVFQREGYPYFSRDFELAGGDFTYAIQMGEQITWPEAEAYKKNYDVTRHDVSVEPYLQRWLEEVRKSIVAFSRAFPEVETRVERIVLSGGSAVWTGLARLLSEHLNLPVGVDTWELLTNNAANGSGGAEYKTVVGLALGE